MPDNLQTPDIHERFRLLLKALNHSANSFARLIGVNPSQIVNVVGGRLNKPSLDTLEKISGTLPRVNMEWVVAGRGEMMKPWPGQEQPVVSMSGNTGNVVNTMSGGEVSFGFASVEDCTKQLQLTQQRVKELEGIIQDKDLIIQLLRRTERN